MAIKITLIWEGEVDEESLELFKDSPADCLEFLENADESRLIIEKDGEVVSEVMN